jgi:N-acetylglucosamine kinase-like BadF-type ATPase
MFLGVDGGASKTLAVVVDAEGREVGRGLAGSGNHTVAGAERAAENIWAAAEAAARQAGARLPLDWAWLGLAGVHRAMGRATMLPHLGGIAHELKLTNDAALALGALPRGCGVALIAGTGSFALGHDAAGNVAQAGGWGHVMGDEGAGYDLGRRALQAALRASDARGPRTELLPSILRAWSLEEPADLVPQVYAAFDATRIAQLAPVVLDVAAAGDATARAIVARGAAELALGALTVASQLALPADTLPLALVGSLMLHAPAYRQQVLRLVRRRRPQGETALVSDPALSAAQSLAANIRRSAIGR